MPHVAAHHDHDHAAASSAETGTSCCGGDAVAPTQVSASDGRSFHVNGLDCAEEVSILNRVVGPEVGGTEFLAYHQGGRINWHDGQTVGCRGRQR